MFNWTKILFFRQEYFIFLLQELLVQMIISAIDLEYLKYLFKRTSFFSVIISVIER